MEKQNYISPQIEVIEVQIEQGFAASLPMEGVFRDETADW